jgi:hypothetical protein
VSRCAVSTLSADGLFFAGGFLAGMRADKTLDARSRWCAWFGQSFRSWKPRTGSDWSFRSWSETLPIYGNAVFAPNSKRRALYIPDADHLPLCLWVIKLVCVNPAIIAPHRRGTLSGRRRSHPPAQHDIDCCWPRVRHRPRGHCDSRPQHSP